MLWLEAKTGRNFFLSEEQFIFYRDLYEMTCIFKRENVEDSNYLLTKENDQLYFLIYTVVTSEFVGVV